MIKECIFVPSSIVEETLSQESVDGKRALEPLKALAVEKGLPVSILEDKNVVNDTEVHRHEDDLWICITGEVNFTVGGAMENPEARFLKDGGVNDKELWAKNIIGGTTYALKAGDILYIPAGQPHSHETKNEARLYIVKLPAKEIVPLSEVRGSK